MTYVIPEGATLHYTASGRHLLFIKGCEAIWGDEWVIPAAKALDINLRSAKRMKKNEVPIPPGVLTDLAALLQKEGARLQALARMLQHAVQS